MSVLLPLCVSAIMGAIHDPCEVMHTKSTEIGEGIGN